MKTNEQTYDVIMHPNVLKVLQFMEQEIPAADLQNVAEQVQMISKILWRRYGTSIPSDKFIGLEITPKPIVSQQSASSE